MRKLILVCIFFSVFQWANAQKKQSIREIITTQQELWNRGDIPGFMAYYWKSDSLKFIGAKGVTRGWNATLERYLKNYPDKNAIGKLQFDIQEIDQFSEDTAWVLGKWYLFRPVNGDIGGYFTLIFKRINGHWLIVSDHTS